MQKTRRILSALIGTIALVGLALAPLSASAQYYGGYGGMQQPMYGYGGGYGGGYGYQMPQPHYYNPLPTQSYSYARYGIYSPAYYPPQMNYNYGYGGNYGGYNNYQPPMHYVYVQY